MRKRGGGEEEEAQSHRGTAREWTDQVRLAFRKNRKQVKCVIFKEDLYESTEVLLKQMSSVKNLLGKVR